MLTATTVIMKLSIHLQCKNDIRKQIALQRESNDIKTLFIIDNIIL